MACEAIGKHKISARRIADILGICRNKIGKSELFEDRNAEKIIKANQIWSLDFMSGKINSRRFRTLNVIDEHARECLEIKVLRSIPSNSVINLLNQIIGEQKRKPIALGLDNGSEFTSYEFTSWAKNNNIALFYIQAGKPYQNCYIERFNGTYRNEVLNKYIFDSLEELKEITEDWLIEYNYKRPHSSLGGLPPKIFLNQQNIVNIDKNKKKYYWENC